jgi:menaquinone-specific isochorismate synthase
MDLKNFHELINSENLSDIALNISEDNLFYFKNKKSNLEFLGYGNFDEIDDSQLTSTKSPLFFLGNFEGESKIIKLENYVLKLEHEYFVNINHAPKWSEKFIKLSSFIRNDLIDEKLWSKKVDTILLLIKDRVFKKIVLSRDVELTFESFSSQDLFKSIIFNKLNQNNYHIFYKIKDQGFISVSPEKLFSINSFGEIEMHALAGSMPITDNSLQNDSNTDKLLNDQKLIHEHNIVTMELEKRLKNICSNISVSELIILKLSYIQHRLQILSGKISKNLSIKELVSYLHPTPAVGTMPYENGIQVINDIEERKRNAYSAPIGIISKNITDLAVGLRSGSFTANKLILHSGCGIVENSIASEEWNETENKLAPFLKALKND